MNNSVFFFAIVIVSLVLSAYNDELETSGKDAACPPNMSVDIVLENIPAIGSSDNLLGHASGIA